MIKSYTRHFLFSIFVVVMYLSCSKYIFWKSFQDNDYVDLSILIHELYFTVGTLIFGAIAIILRYSIDRGKKFDLFYNLVGTINLCVGSLCAILIIRTDFFETNIPVILCLLSLIVGFFILYQLYFSKSRK